MTPRRKEDTGATIRVDSEGNVNIRAPEEKLDAAVEAIREAARSSRGRLWGRSHGSPWAVAVSELN